MNVAIFRRSWVAGGAETYLLDFGTCLRAQGLNVEFLHAQSTAPAGALAVLGRGCDAGFFRKVPDDTGLISRGSQSYDLFINATAKYPITGRAKRNWLVVFAPGSGQSSIWAQARRLITSTSRRAVDRLPDPIVRAQVRARLSIYPPSTERSALRSYDRVIGVSQFVADVIHGHYGRHCDVIYPAVSAMRSTSQKEPLVVSIGRFSPWGNAKRHDVLIEAARLLGILRPNVRVALVGSLPEDSLSRSYLENLMSLASEVSSVDFYIDAPRAQVSDLLCRASIYWHAAGYGLDPAVDPDAVEQFGISIVEAMSARAVPFVVPVAGPAEIVANNVNGLYWNTPEELAGMTFELDSQDCGRLATAAEARSADFSFERMAASVVALLARESS